MTEESDGDPGELITIEAGSAGQLEIDNDLTPKRRTEVSALITQYKPLFTWTPGETKLAFHEIQIAGVPPFRVPPYRVPIA